MDRIKVWSELIKMEESEEMKSKNGDKRILGENGKIRRIDDVLIKEK